MKGYPVNFYIFEKIKIMEENKSKKKKMVFALLIILLVNGTISLQRIADNHIRTVDALQLTGCGMLVGLFIAGVVNLYKKNKE